MVVIWLYLLCWIQVVISVQIADPGTTFLRFGLSNLKEVANKYVPAPGAGAAYIHLCDSNFTRVITEYSVILLCLFTTFYCTVQLINMIAPCFSSSEPTLLHFLVEYG